MQLFLKIFFKGIIGIIFSAHLLKIGMKKYLLSMVLVIFMMSSFAHGKKPKHYVKVKPAHPTVVVNVGPKPSDKHVMVAGYWIWRPGPARYEWVEAGWAVPPGTYRVWVPGHWKKTRLGWYWVDGHWEY
jgi:hypothetical protein